MTKHDEKCERMQRNIHCLVKETLCFLVAKRPGGDFLPKEPLMCILGSEQCDFIFGGWETVFLCASDFFRN